MRTRFAIQLKWASMPTWCEGIDGSACSYTARNAEHGEVRRKKVDYMVQEILEDGRAGTPVLTCQACAQKYVFTG